MISAVVRSRQVQFGAADALVFDVSLDGGAVVLAAASFSIYAGGELAVLTGSATVAGGVVTCSLAGTEFIAPMLGARIVLNLIRTTGDAATWTSQHLFDVVRYKFAVTVSDAELLRYYPAIDDDRWTGETTYVDQIEQAFAEVMFDIRLRGYSGSQLVDVGMLNHAIIHKALSLIFAGFMRGAGDAWDVRYLYEEAKYQKIMGSISFPVSSDLSGVESGKVAMASVRFSR